MELDHLFIVVPDASDVQVSSPAGPGSDGLDSKNRASRMAEALRETGLLEAFSRVHEGQGTANHRFQFDNIMLELLYIHEPAELSVPPTTALQLEARFQDANASPFGICSRPSGGGGSEAPYPHSLYRPTYLPPHLAVQFADQLPASEPLWFHLPFASTPDAASEKDRQHPSGLRRVKAVRLETRQELSPRSVSIADQLLIEITPTGRDHMHLRFERPSVARESGSVRPHPDLPLTLCW